MIKVAILLSGDLSNMKGILNYVHEKAKRFSERKDVHCDVFIIRLVQSRLLSFVANGFKISRLFKKRVIKEDITTIDTIVFHNLWHTYSLWDNLFNTKLLKRPLGFIFSNKCAKKLRDYDVIATHDLAGHFIAEMVSRKYGIPFVATWHGSDINLVDKKCKRSMRYVQNAIENASCNLFVSNALLKASNSITNKGHKEVIYTGPSAVFINYSKERKNTLREKFQVEDVKVVAFVGNLYEIKNVLVLPDIFKQVNSLYDHSVVFWIIGDGYLKQPLTRLLMESGVSYRMLGKKQPFEMPDYMNVINVLVLPSINEGLPLVTLEAQKCGAFVVGSDVGGISESIGENNVFKLDDRFVDNISHRIVECLNDTSVVSYPHDFSWESAVHKELAIYKQLCPFNQ